MFIPPNADTSFAPLTSPPVIWAFRPINSVRSTHTKNPMPKSTSKTTPQNTAPKLAYTRDEAAAQLGVHPITISRLTEDGKLRPNRSTRRPLYSHDELQRFLRSDVSQPVKV